RNSVRPRTGTPPTHAPEPVPAPPPAVTPRKAPMPEPADLDLALHLADIADEITRRRFRARDLRVRSKPDRSPVTDADTAVETVLREAVAARRPADGFAGEETGGSPGAGRTWIVDPVDGTKNFLRGVPVWATLIALLEDGRPTVGVVSAPALHSRWWAATGRGAWLRRTSEAPAWHTGSADAAGGRARGAEPRRLAVSRVTEPGDAYLSTTRVHTWHTFHVRQAYLRLADACWEDRAFGDFLQHCMVAEGTVDIAAEPVVSPWDIAALQVLVEEAGGVCTDLYGADPQHGRGALSANPRLHTRALALLHPGPDTVTAHATAAAPLPASTPSRAPSPILSPTPSVRSHEEPSTMKQPEPAVRPADESDIPHAARTLGAAFAAYPATRHTVDAERHEERVTAIQELLLTRLGLGVGRVWVAGDGDAVAVWTTPRSEAGPVFAEIGPRLAELAGSRLAAHEQMEELLRPHRPTVPVWFLATVGVAPGRQGHGLGTAVVRPGVTAAHQEGVPAYLETSDVRNLPFYQRLGFTVDAEVAVPDGGPRTWCMTSRP
ncbi:histidinol-phosphatase, partial [Streptomyces cacaoi]